MFRPEKSYTLGGGHLWLWLLINCLVITQNTLATTYKCALETWHPGNHLLHPCIVFVFSTTHLLKKMGKSGLDLKCFEFLKVISRHFIRQSVTNVCSLWLFQLTPGGKAAQAGVGVGDWVVSISEANAEEMTHVEAQNKIRAATDSLTLTLSR